MLSVVRFQSYNQVSSDVKCPKLYYESASCACSHLTRYKAVYELNTGISLLLFHLSIFKITLQHMYLYNVDAIHIYSFSGLTGKRLVAYSSETAGHVDILKADVAWNVHHMEKLIVPIPLQ